MRNFTLTAAFAWLALTLCGQALPDLKYFEALAPRNIGPAGMSGRVTSIDVDLSDPDIIYVGTASGGAWKSVNGGINWTPIFDDQPVASVGAVAVCQQNPSIIWIGTGEGNPRNSANSGAGIFRSLDGGDTWQRMGLEDTKAIHRIIIHRDDPNTVYAGVMGSHWGPNEDRGVYRTTDGGKTWEKILYVNDSVGVADLVVDPGNPDKLIAAMWEFGRQPWTFNSGGPGSGIYISYDGGDNWEQCTSDDGLPEGDLGRVGLAFAPSKPNIVYALVEAKENGLYKSTDGGKKWSKIASKNIGNRPFYYADIFVDPKNENRIYNLFSLVTRSEDGGKTFSTLLPYSGVHPDHHAFWVHPDDPNYLIEGNDGGLNISRDGGTSWRFAPNLPLAQFYHINYDMDIPYNVGGGMQDNGSWVGPSQAWKAGGITNHDWQEVFFGDGFDVVFHPGDNRYLYAMSQGGNVGKVDRETGAVTFIKPVHPDGIELRFNWNAAIAQSPHDDCTIYYGSQFVHKSTDCGMSWEIISPDLTTNDSTKQLQHESGGLTIDDTQAENHTTILAIAVDPDDEQTLWVGTDDGHLQLTRNGGQSWTPLHNRLPGMPAGSWIPYIELSQINDGEAFVIVNDYRRNNWAPMAYHTSDYGQTWKRIVDDSQVEGHALSIVQDPKAANHLWLGTDYGLYFSLDGGNKWIKYDHDFPSVSTTDLKIHPREEDLIIGTFGRAAWILDDLRPFREMAQTNGSVLEEDFVLFDAPDAYLHEWKSFQGIRFAADGEFQGENRMQGAMMTAWVKPEAEDKAAVETEDEAEEEAQPTKKGAPEKVKLIVMDAQGDTIRHFSRKVEPGFNRFSWNMNRNGPRFPSRREPKKDDDPPSGTEVLPGTYKVVASYGDHSDSTMVTVHGDPRLPEDPNRYTARERMIEEFTTVVEAATAGFDRLQDARKSIARVEKAMENLPDSTLTQLKKSGKELKKTIAELEERYMEAEDIKGIQRNPDDLQSMLFTASRYVQDVEGQPSQMAQLTLAQAKTRTQEVLAAINDFMANAFAEYQTRVEETQFSLFPSMEPLSME